MSHNNEEMKVVILAGGLGTRLSEETTLKPKPMVEIGVQPILWHIMKTYSYYGFNDFVICLGYKGYIIKEYFANYFLHQSDISIDLKHNRITPLRNACDPWKVTMIDTGLNTMTGGRIRRIKEYIGNKTFMLTYGDGVADININDLIKFHKKNGKNATVTAVHPPARFGSLALEDSGAIVKQFAEKPQEGDTWINGGFFVLEPKIFEYIDSDDTLWERAPLERLAKEGQLVAYKHYGFWKGMDTLRDKSELTSLWDSGHAPWKLWE